jgi:hypothetical protein
VDDKLAVVVDASTLKTAVSMSAGKHNTVVEEWDKCGGASYTAVNNLTVGSSAATHVSVTSPVSDSTVASPTAFKASATSSCSKGVASMGVYVDNKLTYVVDSSTMSTSISISAGKHNAVVEEWDKCGGASYTSISNLTIATSSSTNNPSIPSTAKSSGDLTGSSSWEWEHDTGTPGTSVGSSKYAVSSPSLDKAAREFYVTYADHGGELYHLAFGTDASATHFVYDTYVYMVDPSQVQNLEMDMNSTTADRRTVILGTQCSSISGTWEYVKVSGNAPHWNSSNIACDPRNWSANTWHHVQIATERDSSGNATYDWVNVDGKYSYFSNASGPASEALGWAEGSMVLNLQIDGENSGSGSITMYLDELKVYRW